jgi:hypothetical protein
MKLWEMKYRCLIILPILLAFTVIPFLDSMACDDLIRNSSSSGSGLEIGCKGFAKGNKSALGSDAETEGQPSAGSRVHVLCPICFTIAGPASFYDFDIVPSTVTLRPERPHISLASLAFPIDKPPQN